MTKKAHKKEKTNEKINIQKDPDYIFRMSHAPAKGTASLIYQMIPVIMFAAVTIMIVRLHIYSRPMSQFFWTSETDESQLSDFFSFDKMTLIIIIAIMALIIILFQIVSQSFSIKRSIVYIPMLVYCAFILISFTGSKYKVFSLCGYNDRFEGTLPLLAYMIMLFYIINTVNSEKNLKQVFWAITISSILLSILGITQATDHDFFRTLWGQKLISPNFKLSDGSTLWEAIDAAYEHGQQYYNFTFKNKEVYQTVYNINYVSFYLTLQVPLFGMLFIRAFNNPQEPLWKKIGLGVLWALIVFNFIASNSSGGFFGLGIIGLLGIIILNKQLAKMWKPLLTLFVIFGICMGITTDRWIAEIGGAFRSITSSTPAIEGDGSPASKKPFIDYIKTDDDLEFSINGEPLIVDFDSTSDGAYLIAKDRTGKELSLKEEKDGYLSINDERFHDYVKLSLQTDTSDIVYIDIVTIGSYSIKGSTLDWYFIKDNGKVYYVNVFGNLVTLDYIDHMFFKDNLQFGTKRGYIWSATLPLLSKTILKGFGADTYCLNFPANDYAWKYNTGYDVNIIVDKPHNMYLNVAVGTGMISLIALIALYCIYVFQSVRIFWKRQFESDYITFAGFGIFCGVTAFMVTGLVNDSTVSVMPQFYALLGCGIATNIMIRNNDTYKTKS